MITTLELLDLLKEEAELPSDYAVARFLNITPQAVSRWRKGNVMSEETAIKVARVLKMDQEFVVISNIVERQKNERIRERLCKLISP